MKLIRNKKSYPILVVANTLKKAVTYAEGAKFTGDVICAEIEDPKWRGGVFSEIYIVKDTIMTRYRKVSLVNASEKIRDEQLLTIRETLANARVEKYEKDFDRINKISTNEY